MTTFTYLSSTLIELAERCFIDKEQVKEVNIINNTANDVVLCKWCNNISMNNQKVITGFCYCQQGEIIYRQQIMMCSLCYYDYCNMAQSHLLKQQNEISVSSFVLPRLEVTDMVHKANLGIIRRYISDMYQSEYDKDRIDRMVNDVIESAYSDTDTDNDNTTRQHQSQLQPRINLFDMIKEEYKVNHDVCSFFYNNERNINKHFKCLWQLRHILQKYA